MAYLTVKGEGVYEKIIEKSRFITYSFCVTTPEQAKEYLDKTEVLDLGSLTS